MTIKFTEPKILWIVAILVVIGAIAVLLRNQSKKEHIEISNLYVGTRSLQKDPPRLPNPVVRQLLTADFRTTNHLRSLPAVVRDSFCTVEGCKLRNGEFDMVDSGATMSTDYRIPGISNRRLVLAALNQNSAVLLYEVGGYANFMRATILDFRTGGYWSENLGYGVRSLAALRATVAKGDGGN